MGMIIGRPRSIMLWWRMREVLLIPDLDRDLRSTRPTKQVGDRQTAHQTKMSGWVSYIPCFLTKGYIRTPQGNHFGGSTTCSWGNEWPGHQRDYFTSNCIVPREPFGLGPCYFMPGQCTILCSQVTRGDSVSVGHWFTFRRVFSHHPGAWQRDLGSLPIKVLSCFT
jgi:hypothetical protein